MTLAAAQASFAPAGRLRSRRRTLVASSPQLAAAIPRLSAIHTITIARPDKIPTITGNRPPAAPTTPALAEPASLSNPQRR
jgi:hypothetical protein